MFDAYDALMNEEDRLFKKEVRDFVKTVPSSLLKQMDADEVAYPAEFVEGAAEHHLLGARFPEAHGGRALKWTSEVVGLEEIGVLGSSLGCLYSLPSIIGEGIEAFGTEAQKKHYLAKTLTGELKCAEALTEPRGGSDFFGAATTARREGDRYIMTGQKRFIVGARGADYFLVYARTNLDPEAPGHKSLSAFLVERDMGVEVEDVYGLMGTRGGGTGRILFREVEVPAENLLGPEHGGALVFNRMMVPERLTSAAGSIGAARAALEVAARYSDKRKAFGQKIRRFEGVSFKVAESLSKLDAARGLTYAAARTADSGRDPRRIVSEAKRFATLAAWEVINDAMQIMGGIGYTNVYPVERLLRDQRLPMIWTGTNEIMNLLIQHEYFKELKAEDSDRRDIEMDALNADKADEKVYE